MHSKISCLFVRSDSLNGLLFINSGMTTFSNVLLYTLITFLYASFTVNKREMQPENDANNIDNPCIFVVYGKSIQTTRGAEACMNSLTGKFTIIQCMM